MRLLATSDWQVGAGARYGHGTYGPGSRLADQEQTLTRIAQLAHDRDVDLIVHAGDVLHTRAPSVAEILTAKRALEAMPCQVLVVAGNHDRSGAAGPATPEIFESDQVEVSLRPDVLHYGGLSVATLPWAPPGHWVARAGRDGDVNAGIADALARTCADLRADCQPGLPAVLVLHWWVEGATTGHGVGEGVIFEPVIPWAPLEEQGWSLIVAGHVHRSQLLGGEDARVPGFYCGPPAVCDFGEAGVAHGVWLVDTDEPWRPEFVTLPDRPFVTITFEVDELLAVTSGDHDFSARSEYEGAVIRARYAATAEQARRIDQAALRAALEDAGAHRVFIEPLVERASDRRRVEGVDESMDPLAAVAAWAVTQGLDEADASWLGAHTADLLQETA